jgi:hypothetical protein
LLRLETLDDSQGIDDNDDGCAQLLPLSYMEYVGENIVLVKEYRCRDFYGLAGSQPHDYEVDSGMPSLCLHICATYLSLATERFEGFLSYFVF